MTNKTKKKVKKYIVLIALLTIPYCIFSQENSPYKVGDSLFYFNNKITNVKTGVCVVVKEVEKAKNNKKYIYRVEKFLLDSIKNNYFLESKFSCIDLYTLVADGNYVSYHKNGNIASEGKITFGKKGSGIWTYYYKNGQKKLEEKRIDGTKEEVINFWNEEGLQTVTNGKGFVVITDEKGITTKGSYKNGKKEGVWSAFDEETKKYRETYKKGVLVEGTSRNDEGAFFNYQELNSPPYFKKKDNKAVKKYVAKNFKTKRGGVVGDIFVHFLVTKKGLVENIIIKEGLTQDYNKEAKRVISKMKWTPAKKRGQPYTTKHTLRLYFSR